MPISVRIMYANRSVAINNTLTCFRYEHETELLREQLRQREQDRERQKRSWEMAERAADERRESERAQLLRQEEELSQRMRQQDDELRRRQQENTLFVQVISITCLLLSVTTAYSFFLLRFRRMGINNIGPIL